MTDERVAEIRAAALPISRAILRAADELNMDRLTFLGWVAGPIKRDELKPRPTEETYAIP